MDLQRTFVSISAFLAAVAAGGLSQASNICSETVPSNRSIDGIPAYAQCADSTSSAVYSNNGVDTATSSGGTGWVRTQMSGGYQCTELAHRYLYFKWNVQSVPNGNAGVWCNGTIPAGLVKNTTPVHGDLIVFAPGSCGADATTGHVAVVDVVNADSTVTFVEQNSPSRRKCAISTAACFLHATANTGASVDGGAKDDAAPDAGGDDSAPLADATPRRNDAFSASERPSFGAGGSSGSGGAVSTGGAKGSGGVAGVGGAVAAGGRVGLGGASGSGGITGLGGTNAVAGTTGLAGAVGAGGANGSGGSPGTIEPSGSGGSPTVQTAPPSDSSSGCSCRLSTAKRRGWTSTVAVLLLGLLLVGRRVVRDRRPGTRVQHRR